MKFADWDWADGARGIWRAQGDECDEWETEEGGGLMSREVDDGPGGWRADVLMVGRPGPDEGQACCLEVSV